MLIKGFQKLTLLDYPEKTACTIFTPGCNFRCPFCHNASLVENASPENMYTEEYIFSFLEKRKGLLDGVCVTGGEPLLQADILSFLGKIKDMGFLLKLDTNGTSPEKLKEAVKRGLVDYVAMDIKNCEEKYSLTAGTSVDMQKINESIDFLLSDKVDYEFRTTVVAEFHTERDIEKISKRISGAKRYFLQNFVFSGDIFGDNLSSVGKDNLEKMRICALSQISDVQIRGI